VCPHDAQATRAGARGDGGASFLPLARVRVLDVTSSLAGPFCAEILAALGADVVKVERPGGGDETRTWGPPFADGEGVLFLAANAGKRSVAVDLRAAAGREAVLRLAARSDVFLQSLRPGLAERLGLGPEAVRERSPRVVYVSVGAFGREGPLREDAGYDPLMQAFAGIVAVTGEPDRPGVRVGTSLVDFSTGLWAALAVVSALHAGGPRTIDLSLFETAVGLMGYHLTGHLATGETPGRHGTAFPLIAPYQSFPTRDGELMLAAANDRLFARLCEALDLPLEGRFATNPQRVERREELAAWLADRLRLEDTEQLLGRLRAAGVPAAPVQDVAQVAAHEQTRALGLLQDLGRYATARPPLTVDGERVLHRAPAPRLGEHTAEVLQEAGYSPAEISELAQAGVVRVQSAS
jgi:crotonobetainyl-CoA:carnitine CoA-transferase CaiB-like acyl-CoA transferase